MFIYSAGNLGIKVGSICITEFACLVDRASHHFGIGSKAISKCRHVVLTRFDVKWKLRQCGRFPVPYRPESSPAQQLNPQILQVESQFHRTTDAVDKSSCL